MIPRNLHLSCRRQLWLMLLLLFIGSAQAEPLTGVVTYVTPEQAYLDKGRAEGVQQGDAVRVMRDGKPVATLVIVFVADHSSAARLTAPDIDIRTGDAVEISVQAKAAEDTTVAATRSVADVKSILRDAEASRRAKRQANQLSGMVSFQLYGQDDRESLNADYVQPGVSLRARVDRLWGGHHQLNLRLRLRRDGRERRGADSREWDNRLYEISLAYNDPAAALRWSAGRVVSNRLAGIGYLDGAVMEYRLHPQWGIGAFAGTQPDQRTSEFDASTTKMGVQAMWQPQPENPQSLRGSMALAGEYFEGRVSREYVYQQLDGQLLPRVTVYESVELDVNRDWRRDASGSSAQLSNLLLNVRYAPTRQLSASVSYDNRRSFWTHDTRNLPDSLFDDALRQGLRFGLNLRFLSHLHADGSVNVQTREGDPTARSGSIGLGSYRLGHKALSANVRLTAYRNRFSTGMQPSGGVSAQWHPRLRTALQAGQTKYELRNVEQDIQYSWIRFNADYNIVARVVTSAYYEISNGDGAKANRFFFELGYGF